MKKRNILLLSGEFPPTLGGAGSFSRDLCLALSDLDFSVTIITNRYKNKQLQKQEDTTLSGRGVCVKRIYWPHPVAFLTLPIFISHFLRKNRNKFDIFLITESKAQVIASKISKKILGNYSVIIHGGELLRHFNNRPFWLDICYSSKGIRTFYSNATNLFGISQSSVDWIGSYGFKSKKIILGVDSKEFSIEKNPIKIQEIRKSFDIQPNSRIIVTACRLEPEKGTDLLIASFAEISKYYPDCFVYIAGEGEEAKRLIEMVKELKIENKVKFLGLLSRQRLKELFQVSEFFVMLTRRGKLENFGLVFIEANACGKAVIAGNTGGVAEAVTHEKSGLLVDPLNKSEIILSLKRLLSDSEFLKKLEIGAYERYQKSFTHVEMARQILKHCF